MKHPDNTANRKNAAIIVEPAVPSDAEALRRIQLDTWYSAYPNPERGITRAGLIRRQEGPNGERNADRIKFWRNQIETAGTDHAVFMARMSGKTVGYVAPSRMDGQWRIGALYVLPEAQNTGVGSLLLTTALAWYGSDRDIYLHVAEYNHRAIKFYQRFEFELTGNSFADDAPTDANIPELEMLRKGTSGPL